MNKPLTFELIQMKTKSSWIHTIKSLNLWGNDLDNISIVQEMKALEVLSLSVNHITTLKDITKCAHLRELYLRRNKVASIHELRYLKELHKLKIVSLTENPIA